MNFFSGTDRRRPTNAKGAWRASWQLHLAQFAYEVQMFLLKLLVIAIGAGVGLVILYFK